MSARFRCGAAGVVLVVAIGVGALALGAGGGRAAPRAPVGPSVSVLVGIRASRARGVDRVVFDFVGPVPPWQAVRYVDRLIADPSGVSVRIAGRAILGVSFRLVQLTTGGGRLLKTARTVKLTANGTFAPILYAAVSTTRTFTLAR